MIGAWLLVVLGLGLLAWSSDAFVLAALQLAEARAWSPLFVGTVLVGFATTLPEMLVSLVAYFHEAVGLSIGNALGSYMANIGMVLGISALYRPLILSPKLLLRDMPLLTGVYMLIVLLLMDQYLSVSDGLWMLLGLGVVFLVLIRQQHQARDATPSVQVRHWPSWHVGMRLLCGLVGMILSARLLVVAATQIAHAWGVSDLVMGLTVVAVGTSLPELAASLASVRRQAYDMAFGNVIGSNIFGLLVIIAIPALLSPGHVQPSIVYRDLWAMGLMTLALWVVSMAMRGRSSVITRAEGAFLVLLFAGYLYWTTL